MKQIGKDLKELREATGKSQKDFGRDAGINYGKIQRIEAGQETIDTDDFAKWLQAAGTDALTYLNQYRIAEELKGLQEDRDLAVLFGRALKIPDKRKAIKGFLELMFPAVERNGKRTQ